MKEDQDEIQNLLAEREWEEFKKSSFGKFFTAKQMKEQELTYLNNKALDIVNEEDLFEVMSLIPQPFITNENIKKADILSVIYNNFIEETEIPLTLPIFSFFSFLSAYCVKNNITYSMPLSEKKSHVNTWVTVLAPSGSAKTYSLGKIEDLIPIKPDGEKVVEQNFVKPSGPAKFIEEFSNLPDSRDGKSQYGFWIEDEVAQMFKQVEREGTPLSEIKEYFLKAYDNKKLTRKSKKETIETKNLILVLFFINTFDSYVNNISSESMTDGLMRRFNLVYTEKDKSRDFTDFPIYNEKKITDEILSDRFEDLFFNINPDVNYTFSENAFELYRKYFKIFWHRKYKNILTDKENFYRTYMMQSWKFAVFYHLILKKEGTVIDGECLIYGMKISLLFANSMKKFFDFKNKNISDSKREKQKDTLLKYADFLNSKPDATVRDFCRKFSIKKADAVSILKSLECSGIKHSIFEVVSK
ncbi:MULTISPECIES: hypothetical protein [Enterobacteriaceae]|jgi:hypothetical protein|uniref:DUF3987 domain-containing protein n=14 Tax=Enterobacteriaceae TaxID=543 RepID=A0ABD7AS98_9ENTR|nr:MULTISPECIES: hypothetical protein [Enterobacteriaceae]EBX4412453.1 hypothetical protein [Salmonella enterica subsp. enterica serovar Newport]ECN8974960.1 hypothetical protein [Salmonella enterica subsp. enterica serovar Enteritidis]EHB0902175.1 hypothetical protein [Shigella sonnei]MCM8355466.1 hypothetical protein [Enterobacter hormaechei]HBN2548652.1 hypothetical protein [Klebsiella oxytoca]HBQ8757969.1 hypothetical protein [Klebsiella quasipneumoniae]HBS1998896.1 hypothetical protein 